MRIGLIGAGAMGSALGASWIAAGHDVRTRLSGRSARTRALVRDAGITVADTRNEVVDADIVVSVVPPAEALPVARSIAETVRSSASRPLVVDVNAVSPATLGEILAVLSSAGVALVDGTVSGAPPYPGSTRTTLYLSGPQSEVIAGLSQGWYRTVVLGERIGSASALKMTTSSMYKGTNALVMQAILTASHFGVLDAFLEDVSRIWPDNVPRWPREVALSATKSGRFVDEMREIAATQAEAGLPAELFLGVAETFVRAAATELGHAAPESVADDIGLPEVIERLR
jgi:3-hydroxyisobutyrate dehydrogenase-like beta-hydroxyacid dehydrogenase